MSARLVFFILNLLLAFGLCSCGGSNGDSSGGGGGSGVSITTLAPSKVMVGLPQSGLTIYGEGFTQQSQVLIDSQPALEPIFIDSHTLQVDVDISLIATTGTHQFSVLSNAQMSNSVPLTVYAPQQGPFVMQAMPGFLVGRNEVDPTFIVAADVDGDGLADVIMPGPGLSNSLSLAILHGQSDGSLSAVQNIAVPLLPWALAVGDVDGNGTPDLIPITSFNSSTTTVSIMLGDGHGNFQEPVAQQTFSGIYPSSACLADLDGDGKLDLVLAVEQPTGVSSSVIWLKNTGWRVRCTGHSGLDFRERFFHC